MLGAGMGAPRGCPGWQAYLAHFQASVGDYPGEVAVLLEDSGDAQMGESLLQVIGARDGEPGQEHVHHPRVRSDSVRAGPRPVGSETFLPDVGVEAVSSAIG